MWQLALLGDVLPAFQALAYDKVQQYDHDGDDGKDCEVTRHIQNDVNDCYADIVLLGAVVSESRGEWKFGIDETIINRLLKALESRFYTRSKLVSLVNSLWSTIRQKPQALVSLLLTEYQMPRAKVIFTTLQ